MLFSRTTPLKCRFNEEATRRDVSGSAGNQ